MGKPNMWNILKAADRRVKRMKIWDSGYYSAYMQRTFDAQFLEFGLRSFGGLCKISNFTIFKTLLLCQFSSDSSKLYIRYPNHGTIQAITFWVICQKLKELWHFEILFYQGAYAAGISKCHFSHNFHCNPSKLYDKKDGYHGKSKCLLQYCKKKLASST